MHDLDPDTARAVEQVLLQLTDGALYQRRLAELRGISAACDSKLADLAQHHEQHKQATQLRADAVRMITKGEPQ
jgi:hypothetical protein